MSIISSMFAAINMPQMLLLGGIVLAILILLRRAAVRRSSARRRSSIVAPKPPEYREKVAVEAHKLTGDLEVRLNDAFREMNARIDTKMHVLDELLNEADSEIAELRRLRPESADEPSRSSAPSPDPQPPPDIEPHAEPLVIEMDSHVAPAPNKLPPRPGKFERVYALADQGLSAVQISERITLQIGEVELILGMRKRREQA